MPSIDQLQQGFTLGDWQILPGRREFRRGDSVVHPEPKQLKVLLSLAVRDGDAVTRDELVDECWDGRPTADEPINRCISQLRKHLGDTERPFQYIDVLVKTGYYLKQPVALLAHGAGESEPVVAVTRKRSRLWALAAVVAVVALVGVFWGDKQPQEVTSIAVMPFANLTGDPANAYMASGFKEELVHTLQTIPELAVKNIQASYSGMEIADIGRSLDVDSVLVGALRIEGMELKFSYQLVRVKDGFNVASGQVGGPRDRLFEKQEELASLVRGEVFGEPEQQVLSISRPQSSVAYDRYLLGQYLMERRRQDGNLEDAIALFEECIALDPGFGPAYLSLAEIYVLLPDYRGWDLSDAHAEALQIVERGIAADPAIEVAAAAVFGFVYHKKKMWAEAEAAFRQATSSSAAEPNAFNWYSLMLGSVGRFDEALHQVVTGLEVFPSSAVLHSRIAIAHAWVGNSEEADHYFARARQLGVGGGTFELAYAVHLLRNGAMSDATDATTRGIADDGGSTDWIEPVFAALQGEANAGDALTALEDAAAKEPLNPQVEATVRTLLGDVDGAIAVANTLAQPGSTFETEFLFLRELRPLQQRPEFMQLLDTFGILEYWEGAGCRWEQFAVSCD